MTDIWLQNIFFSSSVPLNLNAVYSNTQKKSFNIFFPSKSLNIVWIWMGSIKIWQQKKNRVVFLTNCRIMRRCNFYFQWNNRDSIRRKIDSIDSWFQLSISSIIFDYVRSREPKLHCSISHNTINILRRISHKMRNEWWSFCWFFGESGAHFKIWVNEICVLWIYCVGFINFKWYVLLEAIFLNI